MNSRAVVSWTGGKDCNLALYEARAAGFDVVALLTFAPEQPLFRAHPFAVMSAQAGALGLRHEVAIVSEPYEPEYRRRISEVCSAFDAGTIVTGDIGPVDGRPNWIRQCCESSGIEVVTPLWGMPRVILLQRLIELGFVAVVSCVRPPLSTGWLGRRLDASAIEELSLLAERATIDASGEQGEYHTIVIDGPAYAHSLRLQLAGFDQSDGLTCLKIRGVAPEPSGARRRFVKPGLF